LDPRSAEDSIFQPGRIYPDKPVSKCKLRGLFQQISNGFRHCRADPDRIHPLNLRHHLIFGNIHAGTQVKAVIAPSIGALMVNRVWIVRVARSL
jgi:hypothetical protein